MAYILVIDDDMELLKLLRDLLTSLGHEPWVTDDAGSGVPLVNTGAFDVALIDVMMPEVEGWDILAQRDSLKTKAILMSGYRNKKKNALKKGAVDFLSKPFGREDLKTAINAAINGMRERN